MTPDQDIYTHGHQDAVLRSHRCRTAENSAAYLLAHLHAGDHLLDVGCGPGTLTADLARAVSPGTVLGIDVAEPAVAAASAHAIEVGVSNVSFRTGDFRDAGLERGSFDVVHAHQVLQHLRDPVGAMAAMAGLARPGGVLAARDSDYGAFTWSPDEEGLERWREVYSAVARHNGAEPYAGRRLLAWATAAGWRRRPTAPRRGRSPPPATDHGGPGSGRNGAPRRLSHNERSSTGSPQRASSKPSPNSGALGRRIPLPSSSSCTGRCSRASDSPFGETPVPP